MTDSGNYALAQVLVQFNRAVLGAGVLLQVDDIGGIFGKCLGVVRLKPQLDAVLELSKATFCASRSARCSDQVSGAFQVL